MRSNTTRKDLDFYLNLHYPVTIHPDPDGGFVAEIEELPGCMTQGETLEEVFEAIEDAKQCWIEAAFNDGHDVPLPRDMEEYSGKILIRIPRSLHRVLSRAAKQERVSLNQYITSLLAAGVQREAILSRVQFVSRPQTAEQILQQFLLQQFQERFRELARERETAPFISSLTTRESGILNYMALGYHNKQIAEVLGVSEQTIKQHINSIVRKLNVNARTQAVVAAIKEGSMR
ncbi:MAG: type II toxin-antitoxin system HicB family antitoxin [Dehalococcoidia bacterium]|nr:type II toxin-antitoxin system HicB family antitoxin [Dehalococcoidia bacterium]